MSEQTLLVAAVIETLPQLRKYARALSGSQHIGDALAAQVLEKVLQGNVKVVPGDGVSMQLFRELCLSLSQAELSAEAQELERFEKIAQSHLSSLDHDAREALLLSSLMGFSTKEIEQIRGEKPNSPEVDIARAQEAIASMIAGKVLIIEDESMIALELRALVEDLGHEVTGVAPTYVAAVQLGKANKPDLILADIKLADDRTGIEAVGALTEALGMVPTIFITAYPEIFLSGKRPEPAYLISKPFTESQIRTAVGQAMFFSTTDALT